MALVVGEPRQVGQWGRMVEITWLGTTDIMDFDAKHLEVVDRKNEKTS